MVYMTFVIYGDLARIIQFCEDAKQNEKLPGSCKPGRQFSLVTGARNHPELTLNIVI